MISAANRVSETLFVGSALDDNPSGVALNLSNFFAELKRRRVYRVAIGYAIAAWLVVQIGSTVLPTFHVPEWVLQALIVLVALGFPVALMLGWAFDITPSGIEETPERSSSAVNRKNGWLLGAAGLVIACVAIGAYSLWHRSAAPKLENDSPLSAPAITVPAAPLRSAIPEKSIAVLPFENLSEDKANAFFASGIQDEILTSLAKISGLKVVSRTSTARYQSAPENLSDIARALGVAHILEGSVQKAGEKVHVNVQLIRADTDAHIWAESYDRTLADIFGVEAEVARSVADELRAKLSPEEKARVETKPTQNSEAYVLFLRATEYAEDPSDLLENEQKAVESFEKAIAIDPGFALARARLSLVLAHIYLDFEPTEEIAKRAHAQAEESLRLQPDLAEGHHARAMCLYWINKEYAAALEELGKALRLLPNNADIEADMSYIRRRQGRWSDALAGLKHALVLDPGNASIAHEYFTTLCSVRDWAAAATAGERAAALAVNYPMIRVEVSYLGLWVQGDTTSLRKQLAALPPEIDPDGQVTAARWDAALVAHDFDAANKAVNACRSETVLSSFGGIATPKSYLLGCVALAQGDRARALPLFESARITFESQALATPLDAFRHAQLGLLYAYLGRKDDAIREGRRAVELLPESKDAVAGPFYAATLALIYARTGEPDQALPLIERLLTTPAELTPQFEANITLPELRLRWQWDPLRSDPRFQKILAGLEPKTIYN